MNVRSTKAIRFHTNNASQTSNGCEMHMRFESWENTRNICNPYSPFVVVGGCVVNMLVQLINR